MIFYDLQPHPNTKKLTVRKSRNLTGCSSSGNKRRDINYRATRSCRPIIYVSLRAILLESSLSQTRFTHNLII